MRAAMRYVGSLHGREIWVTGWHPFPFISGNPLIRSFDNFCPFCCSPWRHPYFTSPGSYDSLVWSVRRAMLAVCDVKTAVTDWRCLLWEWIWGGDMVPRFASSMPKFPPRRGRVSTVISSVSSEGITATRSWFGHHVDNVTMKDQVT